MRAALTIIAPALLLASCAGVASPVSAQASPAAAVQSDAVVRAEVEQVMARSADAWDRGDMEDFLSVYSTETEPTFATSDGLLRGLPALERRYRETYDMDDVAKRGALTFEMLDFRRLSPDYAHLVARYILTYPGGEKATGLTSLLFVREAAGWRIAADHSS